MMIQEAFENKINKDSIVLFDVFEGAIWMPWDKIEDAYYLGDDYYSGQAQSSAVFHEMRKEITQANTIEEIYAQLIQRFKVNEKTAKALKRKEENGVVQYALPWQYVKNLVDTAKKKGCQICFLNQSVYGVETIKTVLQKCGYRDYRDIWREEEVLANIDQLQNVCYVGQNEKLARRLNNVLRVDNPLSVLRGKESENLIRIACGNFASYHKITAGAGFGICQKIVAFKFYEKLKQDWKKGSRCNADPFFAGYYMIGMHILGVNKWIIQETAKNKIHRILFCSRDGYLVYRAYEFIRKVNSGLPKGQYIQASRRLLLPIILKSETDFYEPPGILFYQSSPRSTMRFFWCFTKIADLFDFECISMERNIESLKNDIENQGFIFDQIFETKDAYERFISFFLSHYYSAEKHVILKEAVCKYYSGIGENDAIFDVGYSGKLAKAIAEICPGLSMVLYLYTDGECSELMARSGNIEIKSFYGVTPCVDNMFREYMIAENGPTCAGVKLNGDTAEPVFDSRKFIPNESILRMHLGALEFVSDFVNRGYDLLSRMPWKGQEISLPFEGFLRDINDCDLEMFRSVFQDDYYTGAPMEQNWASQYKCMIENLPALPAKTVGKQIVRELIQHKNLKTAYWGTGKIYKRIRNIYPAIIPDILIDNSVSQKYIDGILVKNPSDIDDLEEYFIVIVNNSYEEISVQLNARGFVENKNYVWYKHVF